jgi:primase-polymerase (primpol)-like protein
MPTKEDEQEVNRVIELMEKMNKGLDGVTALRNKFNEVLEAVHARIEVLEKRIETIPSGQASGESLSISDERLKVIQKEIEMTQQALEKHSHGEALDEIKDSLEALEEKVDEIKKTKAQEHSHTDLQESIKKVEKLAKDDNKFMEGMYTELKDNIKNNDQLFREFNKQLAKISKETEQSSRFTNALKTFLKTIMEG